MKNEAVHRIEYRRLEPSDLQPGLLDRFERHQEVKRVWRDIDGELTLIDNPFNEDWNEAEKDSLVQKYFPETIASGGCVFAAFYKGDVIAFAALRAQPLGSRGQYRQLVSLHVSFGYRELGIGTHLFRMCADEARACGANKLYISGHSAEETQAFYKAMGCVPAEEIDRAQQEREPCDIQLEFAL